MPAVELHRRRSHCCVLSVPEDESGAPQACFRQKSKALTIVPECSRASISAIECRGAPNRTKGCWEEVHQGWNRRLQLLVLKSALSTRNGPIVQATAAALILHGPLEYVCIIPPVPTGCASSDATPACLIGGNTRRINCRTVLRTRLWLEPSWPSTSSGIRMQPYCNLCPLASARRELPGQHQFQSEKRTTSQRPFGEVQGEERCSRR